MRDALIICGDCERILRSFPDDCIDLIMTSPPYADARRRNYGGVAPGEYADWFLPKSTHFMRVLKPTGTFILNIKEKVVRGERSTYVIKLILAIRDQGWRWTEEFIWHKKATFPGKWPTRFRDSWERLLQFNKQRKFAMYQDAVRIPAAAATVERGERITDNDRLMAKQPCSTGSTFHRASIGSWKREMVYPTNVVHMATVSTSYGHSAAFPVGLPSWFIKLFTPPGGTVLDPFLGSGTTAIAALQLGRRFVGIDIKEEYCHVAQNRIKKEVGAQYRLL